MVPIGAQNAFAIQYSCSADMLGANEVPPNASPGSGTLLAIYDDVTNQLSWNIFWMGLTSPETLMHFHGPAPPGVNAGVQVDVGVISGVLSPSIGDTVIAEPQEADFLGGLWYINLHTTNFLGGELRGQVSCISLQEEVVGGKIIPVEVTSLLSANADSFSWMLPVVLSVLGIGLFVVSRKPKNY